MLNVVLETKACTMFMNGMIIESYCQKPLMRYTKLCRRQY